MEKSGCMCGTGEVVSRVTEWRSGTKRGLFLLLMFCFLKMDKIIACVYADGSDPVGVKTVLQKKERIINLYCLHRVWELVWNFATM